MKTKNLHWLVFAEDFNAQRIIQYDVFSHIGFVKDLQTAARVYADGVITQSEFLNLVHDSLRYFFWAKCEHEILVTGLFDHDGREAAKIDVFTQIDMNWDRFAEYLIANL